MSTKHTPQEPKSFGVKADTEIITRCVDEWIRTIEQAIEDSDKNWLGLQSIVETIVAHKPIIIAAPDTAAERDRLKVSNAELLNACQWALTQLTDENADAFTFEDTIEHLKAAIAKTDPETGERNQ